MTGIRTNDSLSDLNSAQKGVRLERRCSESRERRGCDGVEGVYVGSETESVYLKHALDMYTSQ
jgi:hypothetical protein